MMVSGAHRMIGRVGEVARLTGAVGDATAGHPGLLLIEGPAGIGKTALVDAVLDTAPLKDVQRVTGAGAHWESAVPFGVVRQLTRGLGVMQDCAVSTVAEQLVESWRGQQAEAPLVVVVDDAHWADAVSLQAISTAVRRLNDERVLVVLIARDTSPAQLDEYSADECSADGGVLEPSDLATLMLLGALRDRAIRVGPLGVEDIRRFAADQAGIAITAPTARRLAGHTLGNPRYLGQLLRELPRRIWTEWRPELPAPAGCLTAVRSRLGQCDQPTRDLVIGCAILGERVPSSEVAELMDLADPLPAVDQAQAARLLTSDAVSGALLLSIAHPLVRAAILGTVELATRVSLHRQAAEIVRSPARKLDQRVAAATTADPELADDLDRYAAERAIAGEWAAVADALVKASRLGESRTLRQDRLLRAVDAMIGAGDIPQAMEFAPEVESFAASTLRDVVLGYLAVMRGRPAEADSYLRQALTRCDPDQRPDLMAKICQRRVLHALGGWDPPDLVAWATRAVELTLPGDPSVVESEAVLGLGLAAMGLSEEAEAAYKRAAAKLPGGAQPQRFQLGRGWVDLAADRPELARRRFEAAVPTSFRLGSNRISLWAQGWLARTQFALGSWNEALETVDRAVAHFGEVQIELVRPLLHWTGAQIHALRGDWERCDHHLNEGFANRHQYLVMLVPSCLARAQVAEARGEPDRVLDALNPIVQLSSRDGLDEPGFWPWHDVYANALVLTGKIDQADEFLTGCEELAAHRNHRSSQARLGLVRGRISAAGGDHDGARSHFELALQRLDQLPLPYDRARVNLAFGQVLRRAGKRREADAVLRSARDAFASLSAATLVDRCDSELQAGGLGSSRSTSGAGPVLTGQEQSVARLVARGASNKQVAADLFISIKTVQYHLTHVYAKLGIRSRGELASRLPIDDDGPAQMS